MSDIDQIKRPRLGFTLIELMVVMLLISIVMAVAIPKFDGGALEDPAKKLTRWMINTIRTLRSSAIQKQKVQGLIVDVSNSRMWVVTDDMSEEAIEAATDKGLKLPETIKIVDVQFPHQDSVTSGTAEVRFYPAGYSDQVLIHLETDQAERFTYSVEPLLPKVKFIEKWVEY